MMPQAVGFVRDSRPYNSQAAGIMHVVTPLVCDECTGCNGRERQDRVQPCAAGMNAVAPAAGG